MTRVFVSIASGDVALEARLVDAMERSGRAIERVDMPRDAPFDGAWRMGCRAKMLGCTALIMVVDAATVGSEQQHWALRCALAAEIPILLIAPEEPPPPESLPDYFKEAPVVRWTPDAIARFLSGL